MTDVTATEARKELFNLIRRALKAHDPVRIQHRDGGVVLMSEEDYEGLIETIELLSIDGMRESLAEAEADVAAGRTLSLEEAFGDV
jgi:antitoxin YefM